MNKAMILKKSLKCHFIYLMSFGLVSYLKKNIAFNILEKAKYIFLIKFGPTYYCIYYDFTRIILAREYHIT